MSSTKMATANPTFCYRLRATFYFPLEIAIFPRSLLWITRQAAAAVHHFQYGFNSFFCHQAIQYTAINIIYHFTIGEREKNVHIYARRTISHSQKNVIGDKNSFVVQFYRRSVPSSSFFVDVFLCWFSIVAVINK